MISSKPLSWNCPSPETKSLQECEMWMTTPRRSKDYEGFLFASPITNTFLNPCFLFFFTHSSKYMHLGMQTFEKTCLPQYILHVYPSIYINVCNFMSYMNWNLWLWNAFFTFIQYVNVLFVILSCRCNCNFIINFYLLG